MEFMMKSISIVAMGAAAVAGVMAAGTSAHSPLSAVPAIAHKMFTEKVPSNIEAPSKSHVDRTINRSINDGDIAGSEYRCGIIGHGQADGRCISMHAPEIHAGAVFPSAYFSCPTDYPYPLEGFLSGNPVWDSTSEGSVISVKAVQADGWKSRELSYAGSSRSDPGWIFVTGFGGDSPKIKGSYTCSGTPASPR